MCGSGKGGSSTTNSSSTSTQTPPSYLNSAYQSLVSQAQNTASQPLQLYPTSQLLAPLSDLQNQGLSAVQSAQGTANPYINAASTALNASQTPVLNGVQQFSPSTIQGYENPYNTDVINSTMAEINQTNAQQQAQLQGNAVSSNALGGDRAGIAAAALANQQGLAANQTLAQLNNQNYAQAETELNTQQQTQLGANEAQGWLNSQAGAQYGNLGNEALNTALTGSNALLNAGSLEQQQAQEGLNLPYEEFQQTQEYPFQTSQYLANILEGIGGVAGGTTSGTGTSTTTNSGGSILSQIAGLGETGAGILGESGSNSILGNLLGTFGTSTPDTGATNLTNLAYNQNAAGNGASAYDILDNLQNRGGRINRNTGGLVPRRAFATGGSMSSIPDVGISFIPVTPPSGARANFPAPMQPAQSSGGGGGGGGGGLLGMIGLNRGGVPRMAGGGGLFSSMAAARHLAPRIAASKTPDYLKPLKFDDGGAVENGIGGLIPTAQNQNPITQNLYQRYSGMPTEKLQELAARAGNSPQGGIIQQALRKKQIMPNASPTAMQQAAPQYLQTPSVLTSGGFASGGNVRRGTSNNSGKSERTTVTLIHDFMRKMQNSSEAQRRSILSRLPSGVRSAVEKDASAYAAAKDEGQRKVVCARLQKAWEASPDAMRTLREHEVGDAPSGLRKTTGSDMVMQAMSSGGALRLGYDDGGDIQIPYPPPSDDPDLTVTNPIPQGGVATAPQSASGIVIPQTTHHEPLPPATHYSADKINAKADPWLALMQAGFATMGGGSRNPLQNIGEGALAGLKSYKDQKSQNADIDYKQASVDDAVNRLNQEADTHRDNLNVEQEKLDQASIKEANDAAAQKQELALKGRQVEQGKWVPMKDAMGNEFMFNPLTGEKKDPLGVTGTPGPTTGTGGTSGGNGKSVATMFTSTDANGQPLSGEAFLANLPDQYKQYAGTIRAIANGDQPFPSSFAQAKPLYSNFIMPAVYQYDKTANGQRFGNIQKFETGKQGDQIKYLNTSIAHLDTAQQLADNLNNTSTPIFNRVANIWKSETGQEAPTDFNTAKQIVANEVMKSISNAGAGGMGEREELQKRFDAASSPEQLSGAVRTAQKLLVGQMGSVENQYEDSTGRKDFADRKLTPRTRDIYTRYQNQDKNAAAFPNAPPIGTVKKGYSYIGGDPTNKASWTKQ